MTLADFTRADLVIPRLSGREVSSVLGELGPLLGRAGWVSDTTVLIREAMNRERKGGTAMEPGLALPHARLTGEATLGFALGRCEPPMAWGGGSVRSVRFVFLTVVPEADASRYLGLISGLARASKDLALLGDLGGAPDVEGILSVLRRVELRVGPAPDRIRGAAS